MGADYLLRPSNPETGGFGLFILCYVNLLERLVVAKLTWPSQQRMTLISTMKAKALKRCEMATPDAPEASWRSNPDILNWLESL